MDASRMRERKITFLRRVHAILRGYSLKFNKVASHNSKEGYANVVPGKKGAVVEGVLYDIPDSYLSKLDRYEGYPHHYDRVRIKVQLDNGQEVGAIVYIAKPDKVKEGLVPTRNYLNYLLAASDILSESYLRKLKLQKTLV